jgi:hypothetical protein
MVSYLINNIALTWYTSPSPTTLPDFVPTHIHPRISVESVESFQHRSQPLILRTAPRVDLASTLGILDQSLFGRMNEMREVFGLTISGFSFLCIGFRLLSSCNVINQIDVGFVLQDHFLLSKRSREGGKGVRPPAWRSGRGGGTGGCREIGDTSITAKAGTAGSRRDFRDFADDTEVRERRKGVGRGIG